MSNQDRKRSASELWPALEDQAMDDEMEAVLAMTPEERRRELREAGFDLERVHAQADALGAASASPVARPRPADPAFVRAEALRKEARAACGARSWQACLDKLNEAKALDPGGDEAPEVQALRRSAGEPAGHR